jgi:hypothetical protein
MAVDAQEDISVDEFRLEFGGNKKVKWKKGFSSYGFSKPLDTRKSSVVGAINIEEGRTTSNPSRFRSLLLEA